MNSEILIHKIKAILESSDEFQNSEIFILPCKGDPTLSQKNTSFMIFEKVSPNGLKPTFTVSVETEGIR